MEGILLPQVFYESDADLTLLQTKKIAVIGYGSQGHAHALNLKESGCDVIVGLYPGSRSKAAAESEGLTVMDTPEAAKAADIIMILTPDETQKEIFERDIKPNLKDGDTIMVAHGFNILYGQIAPPSNVAPTASAIRGCQCFMPVRTGMPSSRSRAARVCSVIAFSGDSSSIPSAR